MISEKIFLIFLGAFLSWVVQQYRAARSEEAALVSEHIKDIEKLAEAVLDYWLKKPASEAEEVAAAAKVRARHQATQLLYVQIAALCDQHEKKFRTLHRLIFSTGMGGQFESMERSTEPTRALDTNLHAAELVHLLRITKADLISISRVFRPHWKRLGKLLGFHPHCS